MNNEIVLRGKRMLILGLDWTAIDIAYRLDIQVDILVSRTVWRASFRDTVGEASLLLVADHTNLGDCLTALQIAGRSIDDYDGVYTTDEFSIITCDMMAVLARTPRLSASGTAVQFSNKIVQKGRMSGVGFSVPEVTNVLSLESFDASALDWSSPRVLKPAFGAGAAFTSVVRDGNDFLRAIEKAQSSSMGDRHFMLEELIDVEQEWIADGVVFRGSMIFLSLSYYSSPCIEAVRDGAPVVMVKVDPSDHRYQKFGPMVRQALSDLDAENGAFHLEFFVEKGNGRTVFGECALRRGGGLTHEQIYEKFDVSLVEAAIKVCLGVRPLVGTGVKNPKVVGMTQLLAAQGTVIDLASLEELYQWPGVRFARYVLAPGSVIADSPDRGTHSRVGEALLIGDSEAGVLALANELQTWFWHRAVVAPLQGGLGALRRWQVEQNPETLAYEKSYDS